MTNTYKRVSAALLSVLLLCTLALSAGAASKLRVGVKFWKTGSDKESMANSGIDTSREASLTRQSNGTYTLTLPIQQVSKMGVTGYLTGLTIGDVTYNGTVTGEVTKDTGVLTIKNMPASVLTGSDVNKALTVTCNIQMDLSVLGEINTSARMGIWNKLVFFKQRTAFPTGTPFFAFITPCAFPQSRQPFCPAAAQRSRHPSSPCGWCGAAGAGSGWQPSRPRHPVPPPRPCQAASRKNWWSHVS